MIYHLFCYINNYIPKEKYCIEIKRNLILNIKYVQVLLQILGIGNKFTNVNFAINE